MKHKPRLSGLFDARTDRIAIGILLIGCAIRLLCLESLPLGLNQDEASAGYEAWSLLQSGMDRNGNSWPVLFVSWGSGQNVLMSYLSLPWIALLGLRPLSVRMPNALAGCLSLFLMWKLASRSRGKKFGLTALCLLAVNPWHIMASRWGLESNLLPAVLLAACFFLSMSEEKPGMLNLAALFLGLAPYAYGTAFFLLPFLLLWAFLRLRRTLPLRQLILPFLLFLAVVFPVALCQAINLLNLPEFSLWGITFPRLTERRQDAVSLLGGGSLSNLKTNFLALLNMLHNADDGEVYNALPYWQGGICYFFGVPTAIGGIIISLSHRGKKNGDWPLTALLLSGLLCALLIEGNINRLNMLWIPLIYFSALGLFWLFRRLERWRLPLAAGICACFLFFGFSYVRAFGPPGNGTFFPGLGDAIEAALAEKPKTVYVTDQVNQPYIFALFYSRTAPETFVRSAVYAEGKGQFRQVSGFEGFEFTRPETCDLLILPAAGTENTEVLGTYGDYAVCRFSRP